MFFRLTGNAISSIWFGFHLQRGNTVHPSDWPVACLRGMLTANRAQSAGGSATPEQALWVIEESWLEHVPV